MKKLFIAIMAALILLLGGGTQGLCETKTGISASFKNDFVVSWAELEGERVAFLSTYDYDRCMARLKSMKENNLMPVGFEFLRVSPEFEVPGERIYVGYMRMGPFGIPVGMKTEREIEAFIPKMALIPDNIMEGLLVVSTFSGLQDVWVGYVFNETVTEKMLKDFIWGLYEKEFASHQTAYFTR